MNYLKLGIIVVLLIVGGISATLLAFAFDKKLQNDDQYAHKHKSALIGFGVFFGLLFIVLFWVLKGFIFTSDVMLGGPGI